MSTSTPLAVPKLPGLAGGYGRGVALALVGTLFWSLSGVLVRLVEHAGSWQIVLYRSLSMTLALALFLAARYGGRLLGSLRRAGANGLVAGAALSGASVLYILSLAHVTVAAALFMSGIAPFVTALIGRAWLGEPVPRRTWGAMLLAAGGVLLMVWSGLAFEGLLGHLLALGSAISISLCSVFLRRGRQADMTPAVLWSGLISAALALAVLLAGLGGAEAGGLAVGRHDLALCAGLGAVQLGLGTVLYTLAARHLPAAALQLLALFELVLSPLWVWLVVHEVPPVPTLVGGAAIMAATVLQVSGAARAARA